MSLGVGPWTEDHIVRICRIVYGAHWSFAEVEFVKSVLTEASVFIVPNQDVVRALYSLRAACDTSSSQATVDVAHLSAVIGAVGMPIKTREPAEKDVALADEVARVRSESWWCMDADQEDVVVLLDALDSRARAVRAVLDEMRDDPRFRAWADRIDVALEVAERIESEGRRDVSSPATLELREPMLLAGRVEELGRDLLEQVTNGDEAKDIKRTAATLGAFAALVAQRCASIEADHNRAGG